MNKSLTLNNRSAGIHLCLGTMRMMNYIWWGWVSCHVLANQSVTCDIRHSKSADWIKPDIKFMQPPHVSPNSFKTKSTWNIQKVKIWQPQASLSYTESQQWTSHAAPFRMELDTCLGNEPVYLQGTWRWEEGNLHTTSHSDQILSRLFPCSWVCMLR